MTEPEQGVGVGTRPDNPEAPGHTTPAPGNVSPAPGPPAPENGDETEQPQHDIGFTPPSDEGDATP